MRARLTLPPIMSEGTKLRILLADDHVTMRHGLKMLIDNEPDMQVISDVSDGGAAASSDGHRC